VCVCVCVCVCECMTMHVFWCAFSPWCALMSLSLPMLLCLTRFCLSGTVSVSRDSCVLVCISVFLRVSICVDMCIFMCVSL